MRVQNTSVFGTIATLLCFAGTSIADLCVDGPYGDGGYIFGTQNQAMNFCETKWQQGLVVNGLEVWATRFQIKAIQLAYSDGTKSVVLGTNKGHQHQAITWQATEKVTSLQMWDNHDGDAVARIVLEVAGQKLDVGSSRGDGQSVLTYSGLILGARGNAGEMVASLQMQFMGSAVDTAEITEVKFKDDLAQLNKQQKGVESMRLDKVVFHNSNTDIDTGFTFGKEITKSIQKSLTSQTTSMFGVSIGISVTAGIETPIFKDSVSMTDTTSFSMEQMNSKTTTESNDQTLNWSQTGTLQPGQATLCESTAQTGKFNGDYTSTVVLTMKDGKKFTLQQQPGSYQSVGWSSATSNCTDVPMSKVNTMNVKTKEATEKVKANTKANTKSNTKASSSSASRPTASAATKPRTTKKPADSATETKPINFAAIESAIGGKLTALSSKRMVKFTA